MLTITCNKCNKPLETERNQEVERNRHVDIVMDKHSIHRQEWKLDLCIECAEGFDSFLDTFKNYKIPIYEQPLSSCSEDYSDDEVVKLATDVWGGAGPDCSSKRVMPANLLHRIGKHG